MTFEFIVEKVAETAQLVWAPDLEDPKNTVPVGTEQEVHLSIRPDMERLGGYDGGTLVLFVRRAENLKQLKPGQVVKVEITPEG